MNNTLDLIDRLPAGKCIGYWRPEKYEYRNINLTIDDLKALVARLERAEAALREKELADLAWRTCENCGCSI